MEMKKNAVYVQETDFDTLSKNLIAGLEYGPETNLGNRSSDFLVLAKSLNGMSEVAVSLTEAIAARDTEEHLFQVTVIDQVTGDNPPYHYTTKDMTEAGLAKLLQEIGNELVEYAAQNYVQETEFDVLSEKMIVGLNNGAKTIRGDQYSGRFVFARDRHNKDAEVNIALVEKTDRKYSSMDQYMVYIVDGVKRDNEPQLFYTTDMTEAGLTKLLQEIWNTLVPGDTPEKGEDMGVVEEQAPGKIDGNAELAYTKSYIAGCCLDDETSETFLFSLWIAYCLHQNLTPDLERYESDLMELWNALVESDGGEPSHWEDFESFNEDMSKYLM